MLFVCSCTGKNDNPNGKYYGVYDNNKYYIFNNDNTYTTNYIHDELTAFDTGTGTYEIENGIITTYINGNNRISAQIGYLVGDYICAKWNGNIPQKYEEAKVFLKCPDSFQFTFIFYEDATYDNIVTNENNEILETSTGTYDISNKKVTCTCNDEIEAIFTTINNKVYSIEYIKEK